MSEVIIRKLCPKCGEVKACSEFARNRAKSPGIGSYCRDCERERVARYREEHPDVVAECNRKHAEYLRRRRAAERVGKPGAATRYYGGAA